LSTGTGTNVLAGLDGGEAFAQYSLRAMRVERGTRAQALVEFAFVLPAFLVLTLGMIDLGRAFVFGVAVQNGAREAARLAATGGLDPNMTTQVILQRLIDASAPAISNATCSAGATDLTGANCPWHASVGTMTRGSSVTVSVNTNRSISFVGGILTGAFGLSLSAFQIQGSASMVVF
jgi:Flp pilus assembly protein TadG